MVSAEESIKYAKAYLEKLSNECCEICDARDNHKNESIITILGKNSLKLPHNIFNIDVSNYSNLTQAMSNNSSIIDYEKLDGLKVICTDYNNGFIMNTMVRDKISHYVKPNRVNGWFPFVKSENPWMQVFISSWHGIDGWELWVEGEIPLTEKFHTIGDKSY